MGHILVEPLIPYTFMMECYSSMTPCTSCKQKINEEYKEGKCLDCYDNVRVSILVDPTLNVDVLLLRNFVTTCKDFCKSHILFILNQFGDQMKPDFFLFVCRECYAKYCKICKCGKVFATQEGDKSDFCFSCFPRTERRKSSAIRRLAMDM